MVDIFTNKGIDTTENVIVTICMVLSFFIGMFPFLFAYFGADFSHYVTVTVTHCSDGVSYQSGVSEEYVSIGQFVLYGVLFAALALVCSTSLLVYFVAAAYMVVVFFKSKENLIRTSVVSALVAIAFAVLTILPNFGVAYVGDYKAIYQSDDKGTCYQVVGIKNEGPSRTDTLTIECPSDDMSVNVKKKVFDENDYIKSVYIGKGVTVESNAFVNCPNITSVFVEVGATIEANAFVNCNALTTICISSNLKTGFEGCNSLKTIKIHSSTDVDYWNLWRNYPNVKEVYLFNSVTKVDHIFVTIYFEGTLEEWNKVEKSSSMSGDVYVKDGEEYVKVQD